MNLAEYTRKRELLRSEQEKRQHHQCYRCLRPPLVCYCRHVQPFDPGAAFRILIHPCEAQKRVATGRLSHLCLEGSALWQGSSYTQDARVNSVLEDPSLAPFLLYPGEGSRNLSAMSAEERAALIPEGKKPVIFVVDGTWITARKTMQRSPNLQQVPRLCFDPAAPSRFRLRKQPSSFCLSTAEAIHHTIELLGPAWGFPVESRLHDRLIEAFDAMEAQHIQLRDAVAPALRRPVRTPRGFRQLPRSEPSGK